MSDNVVSLTPLRSAQASDTTNETPASSQTNSKYYRQNGNRLTYTETGLRFFRPLFAKAGFNIHDIQTLDAHLRAEEACEEFLVEHLLGQASKSDSLGLRMIGNILNGNREEASRLESMLKRKQQFKLI